MLDSEILDSPTDSVEDGSENELQRLWDKENRHYKEGDGVILLNGRKYQFKLSFEEFKQADLGLPTNKRAISEVAPDLEQPHDIVVELLPGWGEVTAQFEGDFLGILLDELHKLGYGNPKIVGLNMSGRGTPDYVNAKNKNKISKINRWDETNDAFDTTLALDQQERLGKNSPVVVIGHSMGVLNGVQSIGAINRNGGKRANKFLGMMPANDRGMALVRPGFLWTLRNQVPPSLLQYLTNSGYLELSEKDYRRIMVPDYNQAVRGVIDSSRRFLQLTFGIEGSYGNVFRPGGAGDDIDVTLAHGGKDNLIPDSSIQSMGNFIGREGMSTRVNSVVMPDMKHFFPYHIRGAQETQIREVLRGVLPKKNRDVLDSSGRV